MRDARRRREIRDYYLGISADEITSYLTPASFDLWESVARYRRELGIGARWLEVGGGVGDLAATALELLGRAVRDGLAHRREKIRDA